MFLDNDPSGNAALYGDAGVIFRDSLYFIVASNPQPQEPY
jgi:hypothetical protein